VAIKERASATWNTLCSLPCDLKELQFGWYLVEAQLAGHKPFPFQQWVEVKQQTPTVVIKLIPIPSSITNPKDQSPMVLVGEGAFAMGSPWGEGDNDEHPQHNVYLPAYYIDKYEISMGQYRQCVQEGGCSPPDAGGRCTWGNAGKERYPINCVSWAQSAAYCRWAGKRLPSEAEWEKAARGPDGRRYPWGNQEPTCQLAQFRSCGDKLVSVDSYGGVPSPYGAVQLAGNVWEWVADWHGETYYAEAPPSNPQGPASGIFHVLRGGSWVANPPLLRSADRYYTPTTHDQGVGFRCAKHP
jgi:formylglycine-generating enzyme required for sulfatase activity